MGANQLLDFLEEIKNYCEFNEDSLMIYQHIWETVRIPNDQFNIPQHDIMRIKKGLCETFLKLRAKFLGKDSFSYLETLSYFVEILYISKENIQFKEQFNSLSELIGNSEIVERIEFTQ